MGRTTLIREEISDSWRASLSVAPENPMESGNFKYPTLQSALNNIVSNEQ